ncbi:uncharacterized protein LOC110849031 [Folsomia candida]|uniref:Transmembrane protein n=1 Tax=Folsomia candida TaxID=158441 RepID=A0A226EGX7_FOLCA|nr:uncharacterized protein LOC110849031 [Folsomia candida]OXA56324.1 hypothetical protein Fcan01_09287 [Folsomia candida]
MVTACLCLPLSTGVKIIAFMSILIGIAVGSVSSWCLHRAVQAWKNPTLRTATTLLSQVNTFFGGTTGLYDLEVIYRIITACSAVALIGGFVQFLMSFWLLLAASQGGRNMARVWVIVHIGVICAIGGGFLCIITNELEINRALTVFLAVTGTDFLLLIYFVWVVFAYSRSGHESDV